MCVELDMATWLSVLAEQLPGRAFGLPERPQGPWDGSSDDGVREDGIPVWSFPVSATIS